jgi:hypothetical protein
LFSTVSCKAMSYFISNWICKIHILQGLTLRLPANCPNPNLTKPNLRLSILLVLDLKNPVVLLNFQTWHRDWQILVHRQRDTHTTHTQTNRHTQGKNSPKSP